MRTIPILLLGLFTIVAAGSCTKKQNAPKQADPVTDTVDPVDVIVGSYTGRWHNGDFPGITFYPSFTDTGEAGVFNVVKIARDSFTADYYRYYSASGTGNRIQYDSNFYSGRFCPVGENKLEFDTLHHTVTFASGYYMTYPHSSTYYSRACYFSGTKN